MKLLYGSKWVYLVSGAKCGQHSWVSARIAEITHVWLRTGLHKTCWATHVDLTRSWTIQVQHQQGSRSCSGKDALHVSEAADKDMKHMKACVRTCESLTCFCT